MSSSLNIDIVRRTPGPHHVSPKLTSNAFVSMRRHAAAVEARALVDDAAQEAERYLLAARTEAAKLHDAALRDGFAEGERAWTEQAHELAEHRVRMLDALERECARLAIEIARQIIRVELATDRSRVDAITLGVCAPLRRDAILELRVSPADTDRLDSLRQQLAQAGPVAIEIDPSLASGECVAECAGVHVDGRLDIQLAALERRLVGSPGRENCQ